MHRSTLVRRGAPVAVFAAVLAGLVALNATRGPGDARGSKPLDPLPLAGGARAGGEATSDAARSSMPYGGPIVIPDRLLAGQPTEGPVHTLARGEADTARVAGLARALGVVGEVRTDDEGWVVGATDRVLRVLRQPGLPWYLGADKVAVGRGSDDGTVVAEPAPATTSDPEKPVSSTDTPTCGPAETCKPADCPTPPDGAEPAPCPQPVPDPMPEPTKPPQPTDAEARATAQRVFDAAGLSGATISLHDGWSGKEVVASPVVAGLPTQGMETRVLVELGGRIAYANGMLGTTTPKADYPLLAPREAVERGGAWGPRAMAVDGGPCPESEPCPTPEPREAQTLRLGLVLMGAYDETQDAYLAPAWLLTFEGSTWAEPVLALPDRYIATPPPATGDPDKPVDGGAAPPDGGGSGGSTGSAP